jgi:glycosyltransferase involved in cell wall biosynthesis
MEQALGHVTHYQNVRAFTDGQADIEPVWLPIPYEVGGAERLVPWYRDTWSVRASWRARRALHRVRSRQELDAIVFHTQVASLFSIRLMRHIPTLISLDATPINYDTLGQYYNHRPAGRGFVDRQKFEWNRRAFKAATCLVTWSNWARQSLINDYGLDDTAIRVVPPGAADGYFEIGRRRVDAPGQERDQHLVRLLFVGGDFARKGGAVLIECLRGLHRDDVELHVVTSQAVEPEPRVVVHHGLRPNSPELMRLFAEADLFVLPTYADCLGLALMEAAAAGLPVIGTTVGAVNETIQVGETGLMIAPGDVAALRDAIDALVSDPARRARMGRAGFEFAKQRFHAQHNNRVLLDLVRQFAESHGVSGRAA